MSPHEIMKALLAQNQQHFGQVEGTPFTTDPLSPLFGFTAEEDFVKNMKVNQHKLVKLDHATTQFIQSMLLNKKKNLVSAAITYEEVYEKFRLWREKTITSPSHLHLEHWKVLTTVYEVEEERHIFNKNNERFFSYM